MIRPKFRMDKCRVPILSKTDIDSLGEAYIRDFSPKVLDDPSPVDIDRFACYYLGLTQDFAWLSNDGRYLGMTVFNDTNRVIVYLPEKNEADYMSVRAGTVIIDNTLLEEGKEGRYRFTMGHETGHSIFHSAYYAYDPNQLSMFDTPAAPMVQCRVDGTHNLRQKAPKLWTPSERMEWQANRMASALLMPRSAVHKLVRSLPMEKGIDHDIAAILAVSDTFNVSNEAAQYRLLDFELIRSTAPVQTLIDFADAI